MVPWARIKPVRSVVNGPQLEEMDGRKEIPQPSIFIAAVQFTSFEPDTLGNLPGEIRLFYHLPLGCCQCS